MAVAPELRVPARAIAPPWDPDLPATLIHRLRLGWQGGQFRPTLSLDCHQGCLLWRMIRPDRGRSSRPVPAARSRLTSVLLRDLGQHEEPAGTFLTVAQHGLVGDMSLTGRDRQWFTSCVAIDHGSIPRKRCHASGSPRRLARSPTVCQMRCTDGGRAMAERGHTAYPQANQSVSLLQLVTGCDPAIRTVMIYGPPRREFHH